MRLIGAVPVFAFALGLSGCVHPKLITSYESLRAALHPGDAVEVTTSTGMRSGVVDTMSADSLTIVSGGARRAIPRAAIVRLQETRRFWRHDAAIGAATGGGTGAAIGGFSDCRAGHTSCESTRVGGFVGSALVGAAVGAMIGTKRKPA